MAYVPGQTCALGTGMSYTDLRHLCMLPQLLATTKVTKKHIYTCIYCSALYVHVCRDGVMCPKATAPISASPVPVSRVYGSMT